MGVELWRQGASGNAMTALHKFGICQVRVAALHNIDILCKEHSDTMSQWKEALSVSVEQLKIYIYTL